MLFLLSSYCFIVILLLYCHPEPAKRVKDPSKNYFCCNKDPSLRSG